MGGQAILTSIVLHAKADYVEKKAVSWYSWSESQDMPALKITPE